MRITKVQKITGQQVLGAPEGLVRYDYESDLDNHPDWALLCPPARDDGLWLVMIHGHGSHGDQLYTRPDLRDQWLPHFRRLGLGLLTPNLCDNAWMGPAAAHDLHDLLAFMRGECGARQFLFASGSMGGTSNLIYAVLHPQDVAGVVALCPATDLASYHAWCRERNTGVIKEIADAIERAYDGPPASQPKTYEAHSALKNAHLLTMPVYLAHGAFDATIPVSQSRLLAAAMADKKGFTYVEMPNGHHDSPLPLAPQAVDRVILHIRR